MSYLNERKHCKPLSKEKKEYFKSLKTAPHIDVNDEEIDEIIEVGQFAKL